jgi:hypothetical protein
MATKRLLLTALTVMMGIATITATASAYSNCTTNCSSYGGQTSCTRSCF